MLAISYSPFFPLLFLSIVSILIFFLFYFITIPSSATFFSGILPCTTNTSFRAGEGLHIPTYHITILSTVSPSGDYLNQYRHSLISRQCYAEAHGYNHVVEMLQYPRPQPQHVRGYDWSWGKIHSAAQRIEAALARRSGAAWAGGSSIGQSPPSHEWFFLIDTDFAIQRMATPLESFFDPAGPYDVFVSDNLSNEINMGFAAFRVGNVSLKILRRLQSYEPLCPDGWRLMEQSAFNYMLALMLQERLCSNLMDSNDVFSASLLPSDHDVCKFDLDSVLKVPGKCFDPGIDYIPFFKLLPKDMWSYGNRVAFPWLHAYLYRGNDPNSPLVDFNRFDLHSAAHNPLSKPTDWASHAKADQGSYLGLVSDMDTIGPNELFCKALYEKRP